MGATASEVAICHYRLSRVEYDRAVEAGAFEPDAELELIDGDLSAMTSEGVSHTTRDEPRRRPPAARIRFHLRPCG